MAKLRRAETPLLAIGLSCYGGKQVSQPQRKRGHVCSSKPPLFALHLPNPDRVKADYAVLSELSRSLSGGEILNVCINAIYAGSTNPNPELWEVTQEMLEQEIVKAKKAKAEHSGKKVKSRRRIGFQ